MRNGRWLNTSQPQTLVNATLLLYITAAFDLIFGGLFLGPGLLFIAGRVAAGWGIANERKWGYGLGLGVTALTVLLYFWLGGLTFGTLVVSAFDIVLLVLLLHTQSREYQRIWFK
jgi:hypothetical protein